MENIIIGLIIFAVGCAIIVFREKFVHDVLSFQNSVFGFHFGKRTATIHNWVAIPLGLSFMIFGVLMIIGVIGKS